MSLLSYFPKQSVWKWDWSWVWRKAISLSLFLKFSSTFHPEVCELCSPICPYLWRAPSIFDLSMAWTCTAHLLKSRNHLSEDIIGVFWNYHSSFCFPKEGPGCYTFWENLNGSIFKSEATYRMPAFHDPQPSPSLYRSNILVSWLPLSEIDRSIFLSCTW